MPSDGGAVYDGVALHHGDEYQFPPPRSRSRTQKTGILIRHPMRKEYRWTLAVLMLGVVSAVQAQMPGTTCQTAIPLGSEYKATIARAQTVWYTAWTFDLPLAVYFTPQNEDDPAPEVEMDFSCTTGVYTDSILCSLFCPNTGSGVQISMPHKPKLNTDMVDGKFVYYIVMGKEYRDMLLKMGISYNVEVFVKVIYHSVGVISIAPDDMFSNCMDGAKFLQLGDTVRVKANDKERHVVVPYVQWQQDSIYYKWEGTASATLTVATECKHDPTDGEDESILQRLKIPAGDSVKVTSEKLKNYVQFGEAGMLFAKCYSSSDGVLTVRRVPQAPPEGGAVLLRYGQQVTLDANDTNTLYAIPQSWDTATIFTTPTDHVFRMYVGTEPDFGTGDAIASYQFLLSKKGHWLGLLTDEMKALWKHTEERYLYARFQCTGRTTFLAQIWNPSECMNKTLITPGTGSIEVQKGSYGAVFYRFYYNDWRGGDMTFRWSVKSNNCPTYIGDTCYFPAEAGNAHVVINKAVPKNGTWTIPAEQIEEWADRTDPDGYLYLRFNPSQGGTMEITTTAPAEQDPELPHAIVHVSCIDGYPHMLLVTVSVPQTLTVTADGTTVEQWEATPAEPHTLTLSAGQYTLTGTKEEILLFVP